MILKNVKTNLIFMIFSVFALQNIWSYDEVLYHKIKEKMDSHKTYSVDIKLTNDRSIGKGVEYYLFPRIRKEEVIVYDFNGKKSGSFIDIKNDKEKIVYYEPINTVIIEETNETDTTSVSSFLYDIAIEQNLKDVVNIAGRCHLTYLSKVKNQRIEMIVDYETGLVEKILYSNNGKVYSEVEFSNYNTDVKLDISFFEFKIPKDAIVVDKRKSLPVQNKNLK